MKTEEKQDTQHKNEGQSPEKGNHEPNKKKDDPNKADNDEKERKAIEKDKDKEDLTAQETSGGDEKQ